jgi:hypothetical protein
MSQPPLSYQSPTVYPQQPQKPAFLTVMAVLGIVFGGLGVLCVGGGEIANVFMLFHSRISPVMAAQPVATKIVNLVIGLFGFVLSGILLWGSIGAINLKPAARQLLLGWAVVDVIFDFLRMAIGLLMFYLMPLAVQNAAFQNNPAFANNPNAAQFMSYAKVFGVIGALLWWVLGTAFAVLIYVCYRNPQVVAAFEPKPQNIGIAMPAPPM